jgi:long-subunit acyl-CoA synthetase (AMP-forming)
VTEATAGPTVAAWLAHDVAEVGDRVAVRRMAPDGSGLAEWTWAEVGDRAARLATAFGRLGLGRGERLLLFLRNRPEFHVADLGAVLAGGTPLSIYNSSAPEQVAQLAGHSRSRIAVVEDVEFLERLLKVRDELPELRAVVVVDDPDGLRPADVHLLADLYGDDPVDLAAAAAAIRPDDLATVIYTSGTTGAPKGVMLTHENIQAQCVGYTTLVGPNPGRRTVSYLPMAHIAERMVTHYSWLWQQSTVTCCPDQSQLVAYLRQVRPTDLFGPPRVFEKLKAGIEAGVAAAGPEKAAGFEQARAVGRQVAELRAADRPLPPELAAAWDQLDAAVFAPIRGNVGLDQLVYCFSGAAPLPVDVMHFLRSIGLPFSEVYGMSENTGALTWEPYRVKPGAVGRALPGVEVRIAEDGEVLGRGAIVSPGYLDDPERSAETFDADGWLHTGDIGRLDEDGYLTIVDRKKELIITAGGKNISPANLEALLKSLPLVGQACVVGDGRRYLVALLVLDPEVAPAWAARQGLPAAPAELAAAPEVRAELERGVAEINARVSQVEGIKKFAILPDEWLPDSPQLTATMKLKRRGVLSAYAPVIESLYAD